MLNIEKYKRELMRGVNVCKIEEIVTEITGEKICPTGVDNCNDCKRLIFEWLLSEYKEPVLDEVEKAYLSAVIKPYKNRVISITKVKDAYETKRFIRVVIKGNDGREEICLPWFKGNTKYKGMKDFKGYTVEELGL